MLVISRCGVPTSTSLSASRTIGCFSSSTESTTSILEYFTINCCANGSCSVMYTYLSMAAAITNPECSR